MSYGVQRRKGDVDMTLAKKEKVLKILAIIIAVIIIAIAICENLTYLTYYKATTSFSPPDDKVMEEFQKLTEVNQTWIKFERILIWGAPAAAAVLFLCTAIFGRGTQVTIVKAGLLILAVNLVCLAFDVAVFWLNGQVIGTYFLLPLLRGSLLQSALVWVVCFVLDLIINKVRKN